MKTAQILRSMVVWCFILTSPLLMVGLAVTQAQGEDVSVVTFYVHWYDVGKAALDGLKGIKKVEKGFKDFKEINRVYYDPTLISIEEMEEAPLTFD